MQDWRNLALQLMETCRVNDVTIPVEAECLYNRLALLESNGKTLESDVCEIPLTQGQFTIIDSEDYIAVSKYRWFAAKQSYKHRLEFYAKTKISGKAKSLHRFIVGEDNIPEGYVVDHVNNDPLDNRKSNLRLVNKYQSMQNRRGWMKRDFSKGSNSTYKGVYRRNGAASGTKCWRSVIKKNKVIHEVGSFYTEEEAALAYDKKAIELHGEYANLNFPQGDIRHEEDKCSGGER